MSKRVPVFLAALLGGFHVLAFVYVVGSRLLFPFEIEWMTGSVLDHVERLRADQPLYVPPSADFIPYLYPPLSYWLHSLVGGTFFAGRLVSLACAVVQAICVFRLARAHSAPRPWAAAGSLLYVACYGYTGSWYDLERSDTLLVAMMAVATTILVERRGLGACFAAGAIVGLGFWVKQPAAFFLIAGTLAIARRDGVARGATFSAAATSAIVAILLTLRASSGTWVDTYVFSLPRAHGIELALLPEVLVGDAVTGCGLLVMTGLALRSVFRGDVFAAMLGAGFAAAFTGRLHLGGWVNVLQAWTTFACVAFVIVAQRFGPRGVVALALQLALLLYDPRGRAVRAGLADDTRKLHALVSALETRGEVLFVGRGHITKRRHFQMAALADVARANGRAPLDVLRALEQRRFAAIIDDARSKDETPPTHWPSVMLEDIADLRRPLFASYYPAFRIDDAWGELPLAAPAKPRWVYLPREASLADLDDATLARRHFEEMARAATVRATPETARVHTD